jgi:hypothetical protein
MNKAEELAKHLEEGSFAPNILQNEHAARTQSAAELRRLSAENAELRAAIEAALPDVPTVPTGFILVPIDPTPEMIEAAEAVEDLYRRGTPHTWAKVYKAMTRNSPAPEPAQAERERWRPAVMAMHDAVLDTMASGRPIAHLDDCSYALLRLLGTNTHAETRQTAHKGTP